MSKLRSKISKTILIFVMVCILSYGFTWWNDRDSHMYYRAVNMPLKDRLIERLPMWGPRRYLNRSVDIPEFIIIALTLYFVGYGLWRCKYELLLNFLILLSIGYLLRIITIYVTVFPRLDKTPITDKELHLMVSGGNYDLTSSGHMMCTTLLILFLVGILGHTRYLYIVLPFYAIILLLYRSHYTIDIINGFLIALLLFLLRQHII